MNLSWPRNLIQYFRKKITTDCCGSNETLAGTNDCLSDTTEVISKLIGVKLRKLLGHLDRMCCCYICYYCLLLLLINKINIISVFLDSCAKLSYHEIFEVYLTISRISRPDVFCGKDIPKNYAKFYGKHLGWRLFF